MILSDHFETTPFKTFYTSLTVENQAKCRYIKSVLLLDRSESKRRTGTLPGKGFAFSDRRRGFAGK